MTATREKEVEKEEMAPPVAALDAEAEAEAEAEATGLFPMTPPAVEEGVAVAATDAAEAAA